MEAIVTDKPQTPPTDKFKEKYGNYPSQRSQGATLFSEDLSIEFPEPDPLPRIDARYKRILNTIQAKKMLLNPIT